VSNWARAARLTSNHQRDFFIEVLREEYKMTQVFDVIEAPWTGEQVDALNVFQRHGKVHPFTCGNDHLWDRVLVATSNGWICCHCEYTQKWALAIMAEPLDPLIFTREILK
jgi:hypothetical protein